MIIKGKSRTGPEVLGPYLQNAEKNEHVKVIEIRGTVAQDLIGALTEMDAYSEATLCQKPLYHAIISPEPPHRLNDAQRIEAVDALENGLGFNGHARVVVMHEKLGREHFHIVWTRIDTEKGKAVHLSQNYLKHEEVARDLEKRFGHDHVQGAHAERNGEARPPRSLTRSEILIEQKTGVKAKTVRGEVTAAFKASDTPEAFCTALEDAGYVLAQGDRRDFIIIDKAGGTHSLARRIEGIKAAGLREFMSGLDLATVATSEQAKQIAEERTARAVADEERKAIVRLEKAYGSGDDYVSQSQAALKDHKERHEDIGFVFFNEEITKKMIDYMDRFPEEFPSRKTGDPKDSSNQQQEAPGAGPTRSR